MLRYPESGQWCIKVVAAAESSRKSKLAWPDGLIDEAYSGQPGCAESRVVGYATWLDDAAEQPTVSPTAADNFIVDEPECLNKDIHEAVCRSIQTTTERILHGRKDVWRKLQ